jgi:hypothetical protein
LVVFEKVGDEGKCHECGAELLTGDYLLMLVTEEALAKAYRALYRGSAEQNWSSPQKQF